MVAVKVTPVEEAVHQVVVNWTSGKDEFCDSANSWDQSQLMEEGSVSTKVKELDVPEEGVPPDPVQPRQAQRALFSGMLWREALAEITRPEGEVCVP